MSFGSFLKGVGAAIIPGGKSYGDYNPPKKKKPQPGDPDYQAPAPITRGPQQNQQSQQIPGLPLAPKQPVNVFDANKNLMFGQSKPGVVQPNAPKPRTPEDDINDGLNAGKSWEQISRETNVPLANVQAFSKATRPNYGINPNQPAPGMVPAPGVTGTRATRGGETGTMVPNKITGQPNFIPDAPKPQDNSFLGKVRNTANVIKNTAVGTVANIPELGLAAGRTATGLVQGVTQLPHAVTAITATGTQQLQKHMNNPVTRQINRGIQDVNTGVNAATKVVDKPFNFVNRGLDSAASAYERNVPAAASGAKVYKYEQIPLNALAALLTLGGSTAGEAGTASKLGEADEAPGLFSRLMNKPLTSNPDNMVAKTSQAISNKTTPVVQALSSPFSSTRTGITKLLNSRIVPTAERDLIDAGEVGNVLSNSQLDELTKPPTNIPVSQPQPIEIGGTPGEGTNIPVTNNNPQGKPIVEVGGDKPGVVHVPTADEAAAQRAASQFDRQAPGRPDQAIEGVTPRTPPKTFNLAPDTVAANQGKVIDDYADMLKGLGEGNGTQLVPDGEGGYTRTTNNVRSAENKGKNMTKADWRDEAERQLRSGQAEPATQGAFNDAADPEVQAMLNGGEQTPAGEGRPIKVQQAKGISVTDKTDVPTGLPEEPGTVRPTVATAPANTKAAAAAAETPVVPAEKPPVPEGTPATEPKAPTPTETLPASGESDADFLKRQATDMQSNIKRAVESLKATKKMTKAERANRAAAGEKAYQEAKASGLSPAEQEAARKSAYSGAFDRQDYVGTPIHSADEQRLRDMVDEHYKDMPYQAGNVREAFGKLFHSGEEGYHSETGNHIIPSDIKNIRKFLNESVPNADGNGGLGDFAGDAIKELADAEPGPGKIANAIGLQRALRFTADISATGRQALPGALSHPIEFAKAAKKSFEVMFSHDKYQKYISELSNSKDANYINDRLGAYLSVMNDDISKADDIYRNSGWAHKIPGVNKVVAASERQYNTILTEMRRQSGQRFIDAAGGIGNLEKIASESGDPDTFLKAIGTVSNVNTGRGFGKALDTGASKILSDVLVSPRGLAARLQRFNPKYYTDLFKANPAAGKEALRSLAVQTAVTASALGAANKAGLYEDGQIKVGNTRYDITGGAANMIRTVVRVAQYIDGSRATTPFNSAEDEVTRWARNQLSPFLASSLDAIGIHQDPKSGTWVNRWGEDVTAGGEVLNNIAPVNASQVEQDRQLGTPGGQQAINAGLNTLGIGVNSYQSSEDKALPKSKSARDVYKQLTKEGIGTSTTDVNNYIADGNYDTANRVAEYNLMALQADPKSSQSQIKKAQQTIEEIGLKKDGVPMTDDGITAKIEDGDWDSAIQGYQYKIEKAKSDGELSKKTESGIQSEIKRAEISRDNNIDPQLLSAYKSISESDWRKMGAGPDDKNYDPDSYDPDMYQKLWEIDQKMTKAGVSEKSGKLDKNKYSQPAAKSGSGSGSKQLDTSFGTLKAGTGAPSVQQYDTIDAKSGSVPHISVVRPNIVHKISSSG